MLARVQIPIPFDILVEADHKFIIPTYEKNGYKIQILPPHRDPSIASKREPAIIKMDDKDALLCNTIIIFFQKAEFSRSLLNEEKKPETFDPPIEVIEEALNNFLLRLRWVNESPKVHPINLRRNGWRIDYLNDDGTPLLPDNKITSDINHIFEMGYPKINNEIWMEVFFSEYEPRQTNWEDFILDAYDALPQLGLSIVLANTAVEIFIPNILSKLAKEKGIPDDLWYWIANRKRKPSIEDQYDSLLKILSKHSLKEEDIKLWKEFQNLRSARHNFVHEGIVHIGSEQNKPLTESQTVELLQKIDEIFLKIREWLPEKIQWELPKKRVFKIEAGFQFVNVKGKKETDT